MIVTEPLRYKNKSPDPLSVAEHDVLSMIKAAHVTIASVITLGNINTTKSCLTMDQLYCCKRGEMP